MDFVNLSLPKPTVFSLLLFLGLFAPPVFAQNSISAENGMAFIQGAAFLMGTDEASSNGQIGLDISVDELPLHKVVLSPFYIDTTEVTVNDYLKFLSENTIEAPRDPRFYDMYPWTRDNPPPPKLINNPVIYVTWYDADKYCRWTGKRLPTEAEWEYAAKGKDGLLYPWGNEFDPNAANVKNINLNGTLPVKSMLKDKSPFGVYDMGGNVSEWTSSWYTAYPGSSLKRRSFGKKHKILRGGSWILPGKFYSRTTSRSKAEKPIMRHRGIGFRCARDFNEQMEKN